MDDGARYCQQRDSGSLESKAISAIAELRQTSRGIRVTNWFVYPRGSGLF
jgi:hypothetical protein